MGETSGIDTTLSSARQRWHPLGGALQWMEAPQQQQQQQPWWCYGFTNHQHAWSTTMEAGGAVRTHPCPESASQFMVPSKTRATVQQSPPEAPFPWWWPSNQTSHSVSVCCVTVSIPHALGPARYLPEWSAQMWCVHLLQPEGEGKYEWSDGSCYEGGWKVRVGMFPLPMHPAWLGISHTLPAFYGSAAGVMGDVPVPQQYVCVWQQAQQGCSCLCAAADAWRSYMQFKCLTTAACWLSWTNGQQVSRRCALQQPSLQQGAGRAYV